MTLYCMAVCLGRPLYCGREGTREVGERERVVRRRSGEERRDRYKPGGGEGREREIGGEKKN
jgi:hypothetical protein